jgi:MFS family permease
MPAHDAPADRAPAAAWGLLLFLTALNVLNFVDRQLIASLAPLLIDDLGLSRADIGLLAGFAFVVFYTVMGLALGVAADRLPRVRLVAGGLTLWSAMTAVSGFAQSFLHLAVPRVLVGVGEATLTPAALSMLGDAFPRARLGMATGVYYAGIPMGAALSLIVAGWVAPRFGWRVCFFVLGAIGLAAVTALSIVREPSRIGGAAGQPPPAFRGIVRDVGAALRARPALWLVIAGGTLLVYGSASALLTITWLVQERGFPFQSAAYASGLVAVTAGFGGNLFGGWFADWCAARWAGGRLWSLVIMTVVTTPVAAIFYLVPSSSPVFYVCWVVAYAATTAWFGPVFAAIQDLSPPSARSTLVAVGLLVTNLLGVGPGPWITGLLGDRYSLTVGLLSSLGVVALSVVPFSLGALSQGRAQAARGR